ncbi:MAG TPA: hypothetical protein DCS91_08795 [Microcoleaceae bacterium UBA11344]|jgi:hypothetical protein|nr:hypothetical protein [Microcoleaceae cyanobacterium UBA11344]
MNAPFTWAQMKCWTLLASAEKEPQSNYSLIAKNIVIPLVDQELVAEMPPISELILPWGLDIPTVLGMAPEKMLAEHKLLNTFYIPTAQNSPIPEQDSLVIPCQICFRNWGTSAFRQFICCANFWEI